MDKGCWKHTLTLLVVLVGACAEGSDDICFHQFVRCVECNGNMCIQVIWRGRKRTDLSAFMFIFFLFDYIVL